MPCIIVSPWTAGGWVCSESLDHTSVLRFLEKVDRHRRAEHFRVAPRDIRRHDVGFSLRRAGGRASAAIARDGQGVGPRKRELAILPKPNLPGADQHMPTQAKGERKRTPGNA